MSARALQDHERLLAQEEAHTPPFSGAAVPHERPWKRNFPWILSALFGMSTIILATQLARGDKYQHTGDVNGIAPRFAQRIVTFQPAHQAAASIGHPEEKEATDAFWKTFAPDSFGLLSVADYRKERYPMLAPPTEMGDGAGKTLNLVDTSMAHQLHCLHSIMEAYNDLAANKTHHMAHRRRHEGEHEAASSALPKAPHHHDHSWHLGHCFDYIRQGIMCCGDTALEGAATTFPEGIQGSDGWNAKHVCKDYGQVKDWIVSMKPQ